MTEFIGTCPRCKHIGKLYHAGTGPMICYHCAAELALGAPEPSETCRWCREVVPKTYEGYCADCAEAAKASREAREVRDSVHRFIRDSILFGTPLTVRDFARTWR